jgi:hypothetical protein
VNEHWERYSAAWANTAYGIALICLIDLRTCVKWYLEALFLPNFFFVLPKTNSLI